MKFSIIMPVYNAEKYIKQTLNSILAQSFTDFEIIIINDGSTDNTSSIIADYLISNAEKIKYFSINNIGSFKARNYGINNAKGDYLVFVDSDDIMSSKSLEILNLRLQKNNSDIMIFSYSIFKNNLDNVVETINRENIIYTKELLHKFYSDLLSTNKYNALWSKCIKRDILQLDSFKNFPTIGMSDDFIFTLEAVTHASSIELISDNLYFYRISENGQVRTFKDSQNINIFVHNRMLSFIQSLNLDNEFITIANIRTLKDCAVTYLLAPNCIKNKKELYIENINTIANDQEYMEICNNYLNQTNIVVKFINNLIINKRISLLLLLKTILQNKLINKLLRIFYRG